jgi:uncharacterized protein (DUF2141 family)
MLISFLLSILLFSIPKSAEFENVLRVTIQDAESDKGRVLILVFDQEDGFPDQVDKAFKKFALPPKNGKVELELTDLPPGKYAFTVLHDEDNNEVMNTSFLGIPTEKYGFSNNPKVYFSPPSFEKAAISLGTEPKSTVIILR